MKDTGACCRCHTTNPLPITLENGVVIYWFERVGPETLRFSSGGEIQTEQSYHAIYELDPPLKNPDNLLCSECCDKEIDGEFEDEDEQKTNSDIEDILSYIENRL